MGVIQISVFWHVTPCGLTDRVSLFRRNVLGRFSDYRSDGGGSRFLRNGASNVHGVIFHKKEF
jgi:hypothetical protein